jgi:hypothetical protein
MRESRLPKTKASLNAELAARGLPMTIVVGPGRKAKAKLPASLTPHDCIVLAIDPGKVSGFAIFVKGFLVWSDSARTHADRFDPASWAMSEAREWGLPLMVVAEKWTPGGRFAGARTMAGLGASWGLWLAALEDAGIPKARIIRVHTQTWRAATIGGGRGIDTQEWKRRARVRASQEAGLLVEDDNAADAICIGLWAIRSGEVGAKMPKRAKAEKKVGRT